MSYVRFNLSCYQYNNKNTSVFFDLYYIYNQLSIYTTDKLIQLKFNIKESDLNLDLLLETIERYL